MHECGFSDDAIFRALAKRFVTQIDEVNDLKLDNARNFCIRTTEMQHGGF